MFYFCRSLPPWAENIMEPHEEFEMLALQWYAIFTPTDEMKKLRSGFLLRDILNRFQNKTHQISSFDPILWMFFSHDITISDMLNSLGVFEVCINLSNLILKYSELLKIQMYPFFLLN